MLVEQVALGIDGNHREDGDDWKKVEMTLTQETIWCNATGHGSFKGETTQWIDWDASEAPPSKRPLTCCTR